MLKFFGGEITKLTVEYDPSHSRFGKLIEDMVLNQCRQSIREIEFRNPDHYALYGIEQPFEKVLVVSFVSGSCCQILSDFSKYFSAAHTLKIDKQILETYWEPIEIKNSPALKHFESIQKTTEAEDFFLQNTISRKVVKMNSQLKTICNEIEMAYNDTSQYDELYEDEDYTEPIIHVIDIFINSDLPNLESFRLILNGVSEIYGN